MNANILSFEEINEEQRQLAGGKGGSLARLYQEGFPVPPGFVILPAALDGEDLDPQEWGEVERQLERLRAARPGAAFAVRSSALSEDSTTASFAGEFETVLNTRSNAEIRAAVRAVYASRKNERVLAYSQARGMAEEQPIAIVIQQLVKAEASGVLFTANPVSGAREQAMLTAAWGLGEAIVGGMVTPDTLIVEKATGRIVKRDTADKQVMTALREHGTGEQPVPDKKRRAAVLTDAQAVELVKLGARVEALYGMPMDIEWVLAENQFLLVQARPITTLAEPAPAAPSEWKLPKGQYAAMRNNIVELMPNPLTPLYDTLGRAAINGSLSRQLAEFMGRDDIMPGELIVTVNGYAYNNGSVKPMKALWLFAGAPGILRRMLSGAVERWTEDGRPRYIETVAAFRARAPEQQSAAELVEKASALYTATIDAYGALISGAIPAAWITEALFTRFYNAFIKRRGDPPAQTFLLGFDSAPILADKNLFDLAQWAKEQPRLAGYLIDAPSAEIIDQLGSGTGPGGVEPDAWQEWQRRFQDHLARYGHHIYDLDFANPVPADDPTPLIDTLQLYLRGEGTNPHSRQQNAAERRAQAQAAVLGKLKGLRLKYFRRLLAQAQRFAPLREDGLADVGLSYPALRRMLRELGRRFANQGLIEERDDIFWLTKDEVTQAAARVDASEHSAAFCTEVRQRKAAWRAAKQITPPMMLPQMKVAGMDLAEIKSGRARKLKGSLLKGVAASPGSVTGPACVLRGPEDFSLLKAGDVLVAAITTPAWTPLFARASAVVTDVGGPLSHGSIVAREYGIPAVLGTGVATERIRSGQIITVDGAKGTVQLH